MPRETGLVPSADAVVAMMPIGSRLHRHVHSGMQ